jgi:hypothetical protein
VKAFEKNLGNFGEIFAAHPTTIGTVQTRQTDTAQLDTCHEAHNRPLSALRAKVDRSGLGEFSWLRHGPVTFGVAEP